MPNSDARIFSLAVDNRLTEVGRMSAWLETTFHQLGLPNELLFKFDLSANEALTNVISYAFPDQGEHQIALRIQVTDVIVSLEIEDDGIAFDPLAAPEHVQPTSLEDAKIGGLGIDLIRKFMDECHYARRQGKNVLRLIAAIPPARNQSAGR